EATGSNDPVLRRVARKCSDPDPARRYRDMQQVHLALENRSPRILYMIIIAVLALMLLLVIWLNSPYGPEPIFGGAAASNK
ncbi:MAG: hypothetical protein K2F63_07130, partial [Muribaculaceae bacterium]|nr:hypothetical protein [Muribaculaceae bacterium]